MFGTSLFALPVQLPLEIVLGDLKTLKKYSMASVRVDEYHILPILFHQGELLIGHIISNVEDLMIINDGDGEILTYDERRVKPSCMSNVSIGATDIGTSGNAMFTEAAASQAFGGRIQIGHKSNDVESFSIPKLRGLQVTFGLSDYIRAIECSPKVQRHLDCFGGYVYMITGLKLCSEKAIEICRGKRLETHGKVGLDCGTVKLGPEVTYTHGSATSQRMTEEAEAIFAIKVVKLKYKRKLIFTGEKRLVAKPYRHGAKLVGERVSEPVLNSADDFDVETETDSGGEGGEASGDESTSIRWILPGAM